MPKCNFLTVPTSQELLLRKMLRIPSLCAFGSSWCSQHLDSVTWTPALLRGHSSLPPRMMVVGILFFPSKKKYRALLIFSGHGVDFQLHSGCLWLHTGDCTGTQLSQTSGKWGYHLCWICVKMCVVVLIVWLIPLGDAAIPALTRYRKGIWCLFLSMPMGCDWLGHCWYTEVTVVFMDVKHSVVVQKVCFCITDLVWRAWFQIYDENIVNKVICLIFRTAFCTECRLEQLKK